MKKRVLPYWLKPKPEKCDACGVLLVKGFETEPSYHSPLCPLMVDEEESA